MELSNQNVHVAMEEDEEVDIVKKPLLPVEEKDTTSQVCLRLMWAAVAVMVAMTKDLGLIECLLLLLCVAASMMDRASPSKKSNNSTGCQAETLTKDSTEAQQDQDFWGPECCEPTESVELVQEKSGVWWDEDNKVNVVHCNLDDVSTADEESSDEEEDDASSCSEISEDERCEVEEIEEKLTIEDLPQEILMLHVFGKVPCLGRTLCTTTRALVDGAEKDHVGAEKETATPQKQLPAGVAPTFPLQITLKRYFSSFDKEEEFAPAPVEYKVLLSGLGVPAKFEVGEEGSRKTTQLPARNVKQVFSELKELRDDQTLQQEKPARRRHFEVTVDDAKGRRAFGQTYGYSFPRTPVDGLMEALGLEDEE